MGLQPIFLFLMRTELLHRRSVDAGAWCKWALNERSGSIYLHLHPEALHPEHLTIILGVMILRLRASAGDKKDFSRNLEFLPH